ncbi:MAG: AAA family ATPase [Defluviitaleaceae bacterium]|nr:AAA family ATPase [Defluviitaleaceae bacterium]
MLGEGIMGSVVIDKYKDEFNAVSKGGTTAPTHWLGGTGDEELGRVRIFTEKEIFGIAFGQEDMTDFLSDMPKFKEQISNMSKASARNAFEYFLQMKAGDKIALKSAFATRKSENLLRIKAIGTILEDVESSCFYDDEIKHHVIPVDWEVVLDPYKDYNTPDNKYYGNTIYKLDNREMIEMIFNNKSYPNGNFGSEIDISVDEWKEMLKDEKIFDRNSTDMIQKWYFQPGHQATNSEILEIYRDEYPLHSDIPFDETVRALSKRILEYIGRLDMLKINGEKAYWIVPVQGGRDTSDVFVWKLRDELVRAIKELNLFSYSVDDFLSDVYMDSEKYDNIITLLNRKKNIIFQGSPGVGKSYLAKKLAYSMLDGEDKRKIEMVQFHPSYSYEDFIEGFRPIENGQFAIKKGVFHKFCERAKKDKANKYFFIIDEINRGNLSKIMGELMLLLEHDKRGEEFAIPLAYSGDRFYVPKNVYIIGMMNTADRSLAMIDYALRRRFGFVSIEPAFSNENFKTNFKYDKSSEVIEIINKLNALIINALGSGYQIGHSYFCSNEPFTEQDIKNIFSYEIAELLREYFFDDDSKLEEALGWLP